MIVLYCQSFKKKKFYDLSPYSCVTCQIPLDEITSSFRRFGHLVVDWPHKAESKSYFPPKGISKSIKLTYLWLVTSIYIEPARYYDMMQISECHLNSDKPR